MSQMRFMDARDFAINAHGEQIYGCGHYVIHLRAVVNVLKRFKVCTPIMESAAWLHDVLEDTPVTPQDILDAFGPNVAALVFAVTDEKGANRKERHIKTYPKIRKHGVDAVRLKLADRIANVEHSITFDTKHLKMYQREFAEFSTALYSSGECDAMWNHLRRLCS